MTFKVEYRTRCKICDSAITQKRFRSYCSHECRCKAQTIKYKAYRANWQRQRKDKEATKPSPNKIQCLICKRWYVQVGSHVYLRHGGTARDYREAYGFDVKRGLVPEWYRAFKESQCKENGTVANLKKGKKYWFVKGDKNAGRYKRSPQTLQRLKKQIKKQYST